MIFMILNAGHTVLFITPIAIIPKELSLIKNSCSLSSEKIDWDESQTPTMQMARGGAGRARTPQVVSVGVRRKRAPTAGSNRSSDPKDSFLLGSLSKDFLFDAVGGGG